MRYGPAGTYILIATAEFVASQSKSILKMGAQPRKNFILFQKLIKTVIFSLK